MSYCLPFFHSSHQHVQHMTSQILSILIDFYCYPNFYFYVNFSSVFGPNFFVGGGVSEGRANCFEEGVASCSPMDESQRLCISIVFQSYFWFFSTPSFPLIATLNAILFVLFVYVLVTC